MMPKTFRARLLLATAGLLVAGLAIGWLTADSGSDTAKLVAPPESWKEPALRHEDSAKQLANLTQHSLWGAGGPGTQTSSEDEQAEAAKLAATQWRLSGIVNRHGASLAVILLPGAAKSPPRVQYNKIGDQLPDGSRIVEIARTTITVAGESGQRQVKMFLPN